jgi:hypothetical protein
MLQRKSFHLEIGRSEIDDLDLTPLGEWRAITSQTLLFPGRQLPFPEMLGWFPKVRAIGEDLVLIVGQRPEDKPNAWIMSPSGEVMQSFFAGDAIEDVLVADNFIVISYFDEGACGNGFENNGVNIFDIKGNYQFGYRELFNEQAVDVADCYCTCQVGEDRILFFPYTDFPLVSFDISKRSQEVFETPPELAGSHAISCIGNRVYFHSPYSDEAAIYRWILGESNATKVGEHTGLLRGLRNGRFLAVGQAEYTIITAE